MEQIEMLWQYQEADMAADALENDIKRNPIRLALKKNLEFLKEQQNAVARMGEEIAEMVDRVDVIKVAIARIEDQLAALQQKMQDTPPESLDQAQEMSRDAQRLLGDLTSYEQEMQRIQQDAAEHDRLEKEIRTRFAKVKSEYDKQKIAYEAEYKEQMKTLDEKRKLAQDKTAGIDQALLDKYKAIKLHCVPPIARLYGDQCGGCNMSLPQVTLRNLKGGAKIIECETCGRMIIQL